MRLLVGHSFGRAPVRLYAHAYADKVAGMVLVDSAHDHLSSRIPAWCKANEQMLGLFRSLAPMSSFGIPALAPDKIPSRGLPAEALAQYRAILATTGYFETAIAETESFEKNLAAVHTANTTGVRNMPVIVLGRGIWDPLPGVSGAEDRQAWQAWQTMQSELVGLSATGTQVIAERSCHIIQLQQPQLVTGAIREVVQAASR